MTEIAILGLLIVMGTWLIYLRTIPRMRVPVVPTGSKILQGAGIGLSGSALILNIFYGGAFSFTAGVPAVLALVTGSFFFWLLAQRKTPVGDLKVVVGDKLLPFSSTTSEGMKFRSDEWMGKRLLLKFFRGGW